MMKRITGLFLTLLTLAIFASYERAAIAVSANDFLMKAAQSGMNEIALANLALQKSQNESVRNFAQMMVDDHTKVNTELQTLAASKNVTLPTDMNSKQKAAMNKLSAASNEDFDMAFIKQMVKDHEAAVSLFEKQANRNDDADLKAFAANKLPALQSHLQMARTLSGNNSNSDRKRNSDSSTNSNRNGNSNDSMNSNMNMNSNRGNSNTNRNSNRGNSNTNSNVNR